MSARRRQRRQRGAQVESPGLVLDDDLAVIWHRQSSSGRRVTELLQRARNRNRSTAQPDPTRPR